MKIRTDHHKWIVVTLLLICNLHAYSQSKEPAIVTISYHFVHIYDTADRTHPLELDMILRLGRTTSQYSNAAIENLVNNARASYNNVSTGPTMVVTGKPMAVVSSTALNSDEIFQIPKENKLIKTATLGIKDYIIEEKLPNINWEIVNETKLIGQYHCQKAIGEFGGRTYIAWFASELPFRNGPWKLWGLPGLIMDAKDSKNEVLFEFKAISKASADEQIFSDIWRPIKVSEVTFDRARKAFEKNPSSFTTVQLGENRQPVKSYYRDASGNLVEGEEAKKALKKERFKENNPMELTKQKN